MRMALQRESRDRDGERVMIIISEIILSFGHLLCTWREHDAVQPKE